MKFLLRKNYWLMEREGYRERWLKIYMHVGILILVRIYKYNIFISFKRINEIGYFRFFKTARGVYILG